MTVDRASIHNVNLQFIEDYAFPVGLDMPDSLIVHSGDGSVNKEATVYRVAALLGASEAFPLAVMVGKNELMDDIYERLGPSEENLMGSSPNEAIRFHTMSRRDSVLPTVLAVKAFRRCLNSGWIDAAIAIFEWELFPKGVMIATLVFKTLSEPTIAEDLSVLQFVDRMMLCQPTEAEVAAAYADTFVIDGDLEVQTHLMRLRQTYLETSIWMPAVEQWIVGQMRSLT